MSSILDRRATDSQEAHVCGGTIVGGSMGPLPDGLGGENGEYRFCNRCGAFTYDDEGEMPTGTDPEANQQAWDDGEESSPEAQ